MPAVKQTAASEAAAAAISSAVPVAHSRLQKPRCTTRLTVMLAASAAAAMLHTAQVAPPRFLGCLLLPSATGLKQCSARAPHAVVWRASPSSPSLVAAARRIGGTEGGWQQDRKFRHNRGSSGGSVQQRMGTAAVAAAAVWWDVPLLGAMTWTDGI